MSVWEVLGLLAGLSVLSLLLGYGWNWILERRARLKEVLVALKEAEAAIVIAHAEIIRLKQ